VKIAPLIAVKVYLTVADSPASPRNAARIRNRPRR